MSFYFAPKMHPNNWTSPVVQYLNLFFRNKSVNSKIVSWKISATGSHIFQRGNLCFCFCCPSVFHTWFQHDNISFGGFRVRWGLVPGVWQQINQPYHYLRPRPQGTYRGSGLHHHCHGIVFGDSPILSEASEDRIPRSVTVAMGKQQQKQRKKNPRCAFLSFVKKWGIFWCYFCWIFSGWNMVNPAMFKGLEEGSLNEPV